MVLNEKENVFPYTHLDKTSLKAAIMKRGLTQEKLAYMINMSENSLSKKINGKVQFTLAEIQRMIQCLEQSNEEILSIFLHMMLVKRQQERSARCSHGVLAI